MSGRSIIVIGGGVTGLAAAHRVGELDPSANITLLEAGPRIGGAIHTHRQDEFLIEDGPDNFITNKPEALDLAKRLGLEEQILPTNSAHRGAKVVRDGRLLPIPEGFLLMAPTRWWPMLMSPVLSFGGKLRAWRERHLRPDPRPDESLASFVTRRFGKEVFDRLVQPLIAGVYTADPEKLSLHATMPRFPEFEAKYGSVTKGIAKTAAKGSGDSGARYSLFVSFKGGMTTLIDRLAEAVGTDRIRTKAAVDRLQKTDNGWSVRINGGETLTADAAIVALPAHRAATLLQPVDTGLADHLADIEYASSAVVNFGFRTEQFGVQPEAFGFVVPAVEKRRILAGSFSSIKYAGRAAEGDTLVRGFVGGALDPKILEHNDADLTNIVLNELADLLKISGDPMFARVQRWPSSMPQYHVGHLARVAAIEKATAGIPGLFLAGNAYRGVGIPDSVRSAEAAAALAVG